MMFGHKETVTLTVEGMACMHCAAKVENALKALKEVKSAKVDLAAKTVTVTLKRETDRAVLKEAVENAGYQVV